MRSSTTPTSPSPLPRLPVQQRRSSSRTARPRRSSPFPRPRLLTRRLLMLPFLLQLRRPKTFPNTSRPAGGCRRASSLINLSFKFWSLFCGGGPRGRVVFRIICMHHALLLDSSMHNKNPYITNVYGRRFNCADLDLERLV